MGLLAEVTPDEQRLLQVFQDGARRRGKTVLMLLGQVEAQATQRVSPNVDEQHVQHQQRRGNGKSGTPGAGVLPLAPSLGFEREHIQREENPGEGKIIQQIPQVYNPAFDALEATTRAECPQHVAHILPHETSHAGRTDEVEKATEKHRGDQGHDLVISTR